MRLKPYKVGSEPGNATKVVSLVKNVLTCRNSLYNLRHHGRTHFFCHFGLERYSTTSIRQSRTSRKEIQYSERYKILTILKYTTMISCLLITQVKTVNCV